MARRKLFIADTDRFEIDEATGQLFFDGQAVKTELSFHALTKEWWALALAFVTFFSLLASMLNDGLQFSKAFEKPAAQTVVEECSQVTFAQDAKSKQQRHGTKCVRTVR